MDETLKELTEGMDIEVLLNNVSDIKKNALAVLDKALTPEVKKSLTKEQLTLFEDSKKAFGEGFNQEALTKNLNNLTKLMNQVKTQ